MDQQIQYTEALKKLGSNDVGQIKEGIKILRDSGKPETVQIIISLFNKTQDKEIREECKKFLNDIKDQNAVGFIVSAIQESSNIKIVKELVSSAWQSNLDYSLYLDIFVQIVLKEDYLTAYEAFSVVENNIFKLDDSQVSLIGQMISQGIQNVSDDKKPMVHELLEVIKNTKRY